jgi:hypothetical protein
MPKIYWNGNGSRIDMLHSKKQFLHIMHNQNPHVVYYRMNGHTPGKIKKIDLLSRKSIAGAHYVN